MDTTNSGIIYDVLVIGAGHNGLVAAAYLAKSGLRVMVVERRSILGGAAATAPVFPDFKVNTGACDAGLFLSEIVADLELDKHDLHFLHGPALVFAPQPGGPSLTLWRDPRKAQDEIARFSGKDAERYPAFLKSIGQMAGVLRNILSLTPPSIPHYQLGELLPWLQVALKAKRLGNQEMMALLRVLPMPVSDFLDEWFENPLLKAALGAAGVMGSMQGPMASGTTYMMLYQAAGPGDEGGAPDAFRSSHFVRGGMGMLAEALAGAACQYGAEICTGTGVARILLKDGRAAGVLLEDGRQIAARAVVSSVDPRRTFFDLVGASNLEVRFVREVKNIKFRGSTARVNLALSELPRFGGIRPDDIDPLSGHILVCPDLEYLERAYDDAKYGRLSQKPFLDIVIPTIVDHSLAPQGQHLMSIDVRYAPYHLEASDWEQARQRLGEQVVEVLDAYAPGIKNVILQRQVLTPMDLEREYGLTEGSIFHGQMGLDQLLFMRPAPGAGRYRTPVENLYLCGAGAHPGGGVTGAPGYNAAREIMKALKKG